MRVLDAHAGGVSEVAVVGDSGHVAARLGEDWRDIRLITDVPVVISEDLLLQPRLPQSRRDVAVDQRPPRRWARGNSPGSPRRTAAGSAARSAHRGSPP